MDNDLEWLFERKYEIEKSSQEKIRFLSDWDSDIDDTQPFRDFVSKVYNQSQKNSGKYLFSYEQFETKKLILSRFNTKDSTSLNEEQVTLTPGATVSNYLTVKALKSLNVKRVLLLTPYYFSIIKALQGEAMEIIYYHLKDENNFEIDLDEIREVFESQKLQAIFVTDPIYCVGTEIQTTVYSSLVTLCNELNAYLIVDYSIGGQLWNTNENLLFNKGKMNIWAGAKKFAIIDSPTKRLMLNGLKFSVIYGSIDVIDKIDRAAESVYGAFNAPQLELISQFFHIENSSILKSQYDQKTSHLSRNHKLMASLLKESQFRLSSTNSGFLTTIYHSTASIRDIDTKAFSLKLLEEKFVIALSLDVFGFYHTNKYGWRVNLSKETGELLSTIEECIRFYNQFSHH